MPRALYRKYRSKTFDEVIGQKQVTDILARAVKEGHVSHAYLLTGPRGVGKTSVARILAYAINGIPYDDEATNLDIIEIDAASNNGVEDIRDLREKVQIAPVAAPKKVYIIDEVHMLSKAAFNALLKTLEEPPEHVVFILATTNVEKIPETIISRTQRFSFRPIGISAAAQHLAEIAKKENIKIADDAIQLIAKRGDGSFRDSISLLDQLSSLVDPESTITAELIENSLGLAPGETVEQLLSAVSNHDINQLTALLQTTFDSGVSSIVLTSQLTDSISQQIVQKPQLLPLLDNLLEVPKSAQPQLKLLCVLGLAAIPKQPPKTAALISPVREVKASVEKLKKIIAEPVIAPADTPVIKADVKTDPDIEPVELAEPADFDWAKLIDFVKQNETALYSILSNCGHQLDGNELTIYTGGKFYKNKLDEPKYTILLNQCLQKIGVYKLNIHTIPTTLPLQDKQAADIAAIMGGGEEVSIENI
jgi:DNA polymerase-3 subunit gamma/tau